MKTLYFNNKAFQAEKIIKKADSIIGYIGSNEVFAFRGISDWTLFRVEGGEFDPDPEAEKEQRIADLEAAIATILGGATS